MEEREDPSLRFQILNYEMDKDYLMIKRSNPKHQIKLDNTVESSKERKHQPAELYCTTLKFIYILSHIRLGT